MLRRVLAKSLLIIGILGIVVSLMMMLHKNRHLEPEKIVEHKLREIPVIASALDLSAGQEITADMLRSILVPETQKPAYALEDTSENRKSLIGKVLNAGLRASTILSRDKFVAPTNSSEIAARIARGHVAVTLKIDSQNVAPGTLQPGDVIDLLALMPFGKANSHEDTAKFSSVWLLRGIRVLAVNGFVVAKEILELETRLEIKSITVELTPAQAQDAAIVEHIGQFKVALRSALPDPKAQADLALTDKTNASILSAFQAVDGGERLRLQDEFYKSLKRREIHVYSGSKPAEEYSW